MKSAIVYFFLFVSCQTGVISEQYTNYLGDNGVVSEDFNSKVNYNGSVSTHRGRQKPSGSENSSSSYGSWNATTVPRNYSHQQYADDEIKTNKNITVSKSRIELIDEKLLADERSDINPNNDGINNEDILVGEDNSTNAYERETSKSEVMERDWDGSNEETDITDNTGEEIETIISTIGVTDNIEEVDDHLNNKSDDNDDNQTDSSEDSNEIDDNEDDEVCSEETSTENNEEDDSQEEDEDSNITSIKQ